MIRRLTQIVRFVRIALAARDIQDFLWGGRPGSSDRPESWDSYLEACAKRITKLRALDRTNPSWKVGGRKRLIQLATIAVALMERIDAGHDA